MESHQRSPMRVVAPVALVIAALALVLVVSSSGGSGDSGSNSSTNAAEKARDLGQTPQERRRERKHQKDKLPADVYVVKEGDTLEGIAQTTGVPVERLQELNPGLDQFQLTKGQRIKLR